MAHGFFIDSAASQGVVGVGDGDDPAAEGDLLAGQAVGVAAAVEFFVVAGGDFAGDLQEAGISEAPRGRRRGFSRRRGCGFA